MSACVVPPVTGRAAALHRRRRGSLARALRLWFYRRLRRERLGREARRPLIERLADPQDDMLQALLQEGGSGLAVLDRDGRIVRAHDLAGLLGEGGAEGQVFIDAMPAADGKAVAARLAQALTAAGPLRMTLELKPQRSQAARLVELGIAPVQETGGPISGLIVRLRDVTELRRLQGQLAHSQRLQAVGQLAGGIAHDFNNLLTTVIGAADEVLQEPDLPPTAGNDVRQIRESALSGARLVRQLLAFGRQQTLQPVRLSVNAEIERLHAVLARTLGASVALELQLEQPGRTVDMDLSQLEQVLINLAVNARDAMPEGGRLVLRTHAATVAASSAEALAGAGPPPADAAWFGGPAGETIAPGRYVVVEIEDDGVGMSARTIERIFDPFFTTRREQGGNGLGLSTVLGIVRQSDGFIEVRSEPGQGTCFRIHLPEAEAIEASTAEPARPEASAAATPSTAAGRTVLLVEDEASVRLLAERVLRRRGWNVIAADCADSALTSLGGNRTLDLVVTDVVMPGISGPELVRRLRAEQPELRAILVSGYAEETIRSELSSAATVFVPKPYSLSELMQVMEQVTAPA